MSEANEFSTKVILITGAGSGIGRATALAFAGQKAHLWLLGRELGKLKQTESKALSLGASSVQCRSLDVADESAAEDFFRELDQLDICINNAASEGRVGDIIDLTLADFDDAMNVNVRALWNWLRLEVQFFRARKISGCIVNVSSIAGVVGIANSSLYAAGKHAVMGITKSVALEQIRHGIRINAICPGAVETPMLERVFNGNSQEAAPKHPIGRLAQPSEIAESILWLASKKSSFVVGHGLIIDGGRTIDGG